MPAELATTLTVSDADRLLEAESTVRDFCGWHIAPSRSETVTFAEPTGRRLFLQSLYVTAVDSVTVDGVTQVADTDYRAHQDGWLERLPVGATWTGDLIEVEFTHGYVVVPPSVTAAVRGLAQAAIDSGGLSRLTQGPFTEVYALPSQTLSGLSAYRIITVA